METEFRKSHREWCADCEFGDAPCASCQGCAINHIKAGENGTVLAAPTGYRAAEKPSE